MITENYCSYEVAKLLKEKGFNEYVRQYYVFDYEFGCADFIIDDREDNPHNWGTDYYSAPTHQMAMKWLREEKHVYIEIRRSPDILLYGAIIIKDGQENFNRIANSLESYEEAVEAALKYCLENLI